MIFIDGLINELLKVSPSILTLNPGIDKNRIEEFEKQNKILLPNDNRIFLERFNGFNFMGISVYGIVDDFNFSSLDGAYKYEHFEMENEMPKNIVPFSLDGRGNHYCFDT